MVIYSGSIFTAIAYLLLLITAASLLASVVMLFAKKFRLSAKVAAGSLGVLVTYLLLAVVIQQLLPQKVIGSGNSYCWDLWCMGVDKVSAAPAGGGIEYTIDVHVFSDGRSITTGLDETEVFLVDDQGRRFPLMQDANVTAVQTRLAPGERIQTTLKFLAASDSRQLFLTGIAPLPERIPYVWRFAAVFMDLHIGYERISHKPTLLRVA